MLQRIRSSELAIYSAAVIFLLAWFLSIGAASTLYGYSIDLRSAFSLLRIIDAYSLLLLLLFLLLGALPILLATAWKGLQARTYSVLLFLCLGFLGPLLIFLVVTFGIALGIAWVLSLCFVSLGLGLTLICIAISVYLPADALRTQYSILPLHFPWSCSSAVLHYCCMSCLLLQLAVPLRT